MDTLIISKNGIMVRVRPILSHDIRPWKYKLLETERVYLTEKGAIRAGRAFIRLQRKKRKKTPGIRRYKRKNKKSNTNEKEI